MSFLAPVACNGCPSGVSLKINDISRENENEKTRHNRGRVGIFQDEREIGGESCSDVAIIPPL